MKQASRAQYPLDRGGKLGGPQTRKRKKIRKKTEKNREKKPSPFASTSACTLNRFPEPLNSNL